MPLSGSSKSERRIHHLMPRAAHSVPISRSSVSLEAARFATAASMARAETCDSKSTNARSLTICLRRMVVRTLSMRVRRVWRTKNNTISQTMLSVYLSYPAGRRDTISATGSSVKLAYNTPSTSNFDDRDDLFLVGGMRWIHRFSPLFTASIAGDINLRHTVYVLPNEAQTIRGTESSASCLRQSTATVHGSIPRTPLRS